MSDRRASTLAWLKQGYHNNWQQYRATLGRDGSTDRGSWDTVVLTASNEAQAQAYRMQLAARREAGQLPAQTRFLVCPDPQGQRIGSGGATLHVLRALANEMDIKGELQHQRVLILHSGGDSRRLPHCSATGKLFARLPHELPDGRASTLFDEFLASLSGLPVRVPAGVLVASGDTLILFDHTQLGFERPGVIGVAALTDAETGTHHGVYVPDRHGYAVARFLHKPSLAQMQCEGALLPDGQVRIDTGLVWFDWATCQQLLMLEDSLRSDLAAGLVLNLYGDLLVPLAASSERAAYLEDESDGPATPILRAARERCWEYLRGIPFGVEQLDPARFIHFGTTFEFVDTIHQSVSDLNGVGWSESAASFVPRSLREGHTIVAANALLSSSSHSWPVGAVVCICDSLVESRLDFAGNALLSNVWTSRDALSVPDGMVIEQVPLQVGGYVTRIYGIDDNPKEDSLHGTFCGRPWHDWLAVAGVNADELWPDARHPADRTLWTARLYPVEADREASLDIALWLARPDQASNEVLSAWRTARRMSLAESFVAADVGRIIADARAIERRVRVERFMDGVQQELPATEVMTVLASRVDGSDCLRLAADRIEEAIDPWLPMRGYRALELASGDSHWGDCAFSALARLVRAHTPHNNHRESALASASHGQDPIEIRAAARIDFGGGWTDTPPYCLERGGTVLNAAIALNDELPIAARAAVTRTPQIVFENRDIDATVAPQYAGDVLDYAQPGDPFALHKAATVFRGIVPADTPADLRLDELCRHYGCGLTLTTSTSIPRGSGLGTSSILAGTILRALGQALGQAVDDQTLFDEVLCVEQMITTGGGWQDQVGGLVPGIKLLTSAPGLPQRVQVTQVPMSEAFQQAFNQRLVLIYTGQRRLARDLLRRVMGRWMAREPEMVSLLREIGDLALAMRDALLAEDLDVFGELLWEHWDCNKRMYPDCTNDYIDGLMAELRPYLAGAKLAGAGGGGFVMGIAKEPWPGEAPQGSDGLARRAIRARLAIG